MKPPAFQFYVDDFIGGTVDLSAEDVGAYIRLLCYQWGRGSIPESQTALDRIAGCQVSQEVISKFPGGKNQRLEQEREKQRIWREKSSEGGKKSAAMRASTTINPPFNHPSTTLQPPSQPKVNTPLSVSSLQSPSPTPSLSPVVNSRFAPPDILEATVYGMEIELSSHEVDKFMDFYQSKGWLVGKTQMKDWKASMRGWKSRNNVSNHENTRNSAMGKTISDSATRGRKTVEIIERKNKQSELRLRADNLPSKT